MRLSSLTLQRYGNYEAERILFRTEPGRVNILLAPNSAGKSVLRNAVVDLLYGIHNQTEMGFRFGYRGMRVSAEIVRRDGSQSVLNRAKARINSVTGADDQPLDPGFMQAILGGRDRGFLERLFVLDTEGLRRGGADLLATGGDVASALLSAAGGIRKARELKLALEQKRDDLAPERRTSSRPFYRALDQLLDARKRAVAETIRPDAWFRLEQELASHEQRRAEQNAIADRATADIARLQRIKGTRRWLAQRDEAAAWLDAHAHAPRLGADTRRGLEAARHEIAIREESVRIAAEALQGAERDAEDVSVNADLLAAAERIKVLVDAAGEARSARGDLPGCETEHAFGVTRILDLLRQMGSVSGPDQVAELLPSRPVLTRTRQRIKEHAGRSASVEAAPALIQARENDVTELERQLAALPAAPDVRALEARMTEIRADGDPAARRQEADAAVSETEAALASALARVPGWGGGADALGALTPPGIEQWRRIDADMTAKRGEIATASEQLDIETARLHQAKAQLATLARGEVPDDDAVARARAYRDTGWRLIYRRAFTPDPPSAAEEQDFATDVPLPLAFERAMVAADTIADRRAADSEVLGRLTAAREAVAEAEQAVAGASERVRVAQEGLARTSVTWVRLCGLVCQGEDAALSDIQAFLNAREQVIDSVARRDVAARARTALTERQDGWARSLAAALEVPPAGLPHLLALADRTLREARDLQTRRTQLETQRTQAAKELRDAHAAQVTARESFAAWRERWRAVLRELGRPETEEPAETETVLQAITDLEKEHAGTRTLAERIAGMRARIEAFTRSVDELRRVLPGLTEADDPLEVVRDLDRALDGERARDQRRRMLLDGLRQARAADEAAKRELTAARVNLNAILAVIGADTIEGAAAEILALSDERAARETRRDEAETALREAGDGHAIDTLRAEAASHPADEDAARIEAADLARRQAIDAAQQAAEDASQSRQTMKQQEEATGATTAAADQQAAIASLSRALDEAMLYHTASLLLSRALDAVEQSGGSEMLRSISTIFHALTNGHYDRVTTEPGDGDKADLVMIQRDHPDERQTIEQLSEGTRDQLFLALRVAAIEEHLKSAEPLPFIGDDILQSFDDDRALAALRVLADLSQHTQVIVLTHHHHVLDLAARLPQGTVFRCERGPIAATA